VRHRSRSARSGSKDAGESEQVRIVEEPRQRLALIVDETDMLAAAELLKVRAATVGPLDGEAEAVIDQTERAIRLVVAELADMAILVADQRVEEAGSERVVARIATRRHPLHRGTFVS
jgi:hypothetical protein